MRTLGILCCSPNFDKLLIGISEPIEADAKSWSGDNGLFISAPAENRVQALEVARELSSKSKYLSRTDWN
jgi:hypothetical protein